MKLVVLGATGGVGLEIVRQALARNHRVRAFVRSAERLKPYADRVEIVRGDLLNCDALAGAIQSCDAILSGFGPRLPIAKSDASLLRDFATALTRAMQQSGVRRAVIVSTAFLFKDSVIPPTYLFGRLLFPSVVKDATAMEQVISRSALDWTLVRPPQFTDGPHTGHYRVRTGHLPVLGFKISRADVADFCLRTIEDPASVRRIIGISN